MTGVGCWVEVQPMVGGEKTVKSNHLGDSIFLTTKDKAADLMYKQEVCTRACNHNEEVYA